MRRLCFPLTAGRPGPEYTYTQMYYEHSYVHPSYYCTAVFPDSKETTTAPVPVIVLSEGKSHTSLSAKSCAVSACNELLKTLLFTGIRSNIPYVVRVLVRGCQNAEAILWTAESNWFQGFITGYCIRYPPTLNSVMNAYYRFISN